MLDLPSHISDLSPRRLRAFSHFLDQSGAEIFICFNDYEVLRFRSEGRMATIYRRADGSLSFAGPVAPAWQAFVSNKSYRARPKAKHPRGGQRAQIIATLIERDGRRCFYCPEAIAPGLETLEYLLPLTSGGPDHLGNAVLAHRHCNERAGYKSLFEKIRLRDRLRDEFRQAQQRAKTVSL